nr:hypothetical protein [Geodermatophilus normandii]
MAARPGHPAARPRRPRGRLRRRRRDPHRGRRRRPPRRRARGHHRAVAGRVRPSGPHHVHRVTNRGTLPAVSVHAYTPRLSLMNRYRLEAGTLLRTGTEKAGVDW